MVKKKKPKYKIVYNNYQFYENIAFIDFIQKKLIEGYCLCSRKGQFCNLLQFAFTKTEVLKSYAIYYKHLDNQIDAEIESIKTRNWEIIRQNNQYIIFGLKSNEVFEQKPEIIQKQNSLLGVSVKKSLILITILFLLSAISVFLKILLIKNGNLYFNLLSLVIYLSLDIAFLFYFIGDFHDCIVGKGIFSDGKMYFSDRTILKNVLFRMGDILKYGILLGSICMSAAFMLIFKDWIIAINILKMWLIFCSIGYIYRLRVRNSYISLLLISVFLATLTL